MVLCIMILDTTFNIFSKYTVSHKNWILISLEHNFGKYGPIFIARQHTHARY